MFYKDLIVKMIQQILNILLRWGRELINIRNILNI